MNKQFSNLTFTRGCTPFVAKPISRTVGERVREALKAKIPLEQTSAPIFEELPDQPTHNMEFDGRYSYHQDNFDRAMAVIDELGSAVDMNRVSRDAAAAAAAAQAKGEDPDAAAKAVRDAAVSADEE